MKLGQLYKHKNMDLIVKCTHDNPSNDTFCGYVWENDEGYKDGHMRNNWISFMFDEYVKPNSTQVGGNHYNKKAIQPIDYILANKLNFCEGNVVKYITRYKDKNGVEDLKKAKQYIDFLIKEYESKENI